MAQTAAATPEAVRTMIEHLPEGYRESMSRGMLCYEVPLERYPDTYNGQPLCSLALAAQKQYCSLYLMGGYHDPVLEAELKAAFKREGKRLDRGKSCVRFKRAEDLPLEAIGRLIAAVPPETVIERSKTINR